MLQISVILPIFNNANDVPDAIDEIKSSLLSLPTEFNVTFFLINDGSNEYNTLLLRRFFGERPSIRLFELSRNYGQHIALAYGFRACDGDVVIRVNPDLEDSLSELARMVELVIAGKADLVKGIYIERRGRKLNLFASVLFAWVLSRVVSRPISSNEGSLRVMSRRYIDAYNQLNEARRIPQGIDGWIGFKQSEILIEYGKKATKSTYRLRSKFRLAIDGIFYSSNKLLNFMAVCGLIFFILSGVMLATILTMKLMGNVVPGFLGIAFGVMLVISLQSIFLGILGVYLGYIFDEVKRRPLYVGDEITRGRNSLEN